jgi:hypothetical protein
MGLALVGALESSAQRPPDPTAPYESFFRRVAQLKNASGPVLLNGQSSTLTQPSAQDALGLTDEEAQILGGIAADCEAKVSAFDTAVRSVVFGFRLRLVESESPRATQQLKELERERSQIVLRHVQRLRSSFGDSRFKLLDEFVRSRGLRH